MSGLESPDVLLAVAGGLGIQGPDNLCTVVPIAGPMRDSGVLAAETAGRSVRIMAFIPGVADRDKLTTDVARRKLGVPTATVVELLSGGARKSTAGECFDCHDGSIAIFTSFRVGVIMNTWANQFMLT